jgi:glycosyltransferase involved in cell wall biosynthesis
VQNPSLVLCAFVLGWRAITRPKPIVIIDAHNEAVEPFVNKSRLIRAVARWEIRSADFTIVTNRFLADKVTVLGGRSLVLPDPLPEVAPATSYALKPGEPVRVLVVATYAKDEPIVAILEAAKQLLGQFEFKFTGNFRKLPEAVLATAPPNVAFLGFLRDDEYWSAMRDAHAVLDLTLMDDCLVCGAYEAVALGRPMVLSDTRALTEYFRQGALHCSARPEAITAALRQLRDEYEQLMLGVTALRPRLKAEWTAHADALASWVSRARA